MTKTKKNKSILIVDDDELFRESVVEGAGNYDRSWILRSAENGAAALELLIREEADLVVTDLSMPVLDGFQLLAALRDHHLSPHVIVVSAHATAENLDQLAQLGSLTCISKPVALPHLFACFARALAGPRSTVDGITLAGFCQLLEIERHTCLLRAWLDDRVADLTFRSGELIDARFERTRGRAAALEILTWREAHLEVLPAVELETRTIGESLSWLLLEAARALDESGQEPVIAARTAPFSEASGSFASLDLPSPGLVFALLPEGVLGGALIEIETGAVLARTGHSEALRAGAGVAGTAEVLRAQMAWLDALDPVHGLEDIAMILTTEVQIFRPLGGASGVFLVAVFDRALVSLASARRELASLEQSLLALQGG